MYAAAKPDFYRIYRSEQSSDVVRDSESDRGSDVCLQGLRSEALTTPV